MLGQCKIRGRAKILINKNGNEDIRLSLYARATTSLLSWNVAKGGDSQIIRIQIERWQIAFVYMILLLLLVPFYNYDGEWTITKNRMTKGINVEDDDHLLDLIANQTVYEKISIPTTTGQCSSNQRCEIQFRNKKLSFCYFLPYGANFGDELGPAVSKQLLLHHFGTSCSLEKISTINLRTEWWKRWGRSCFFTLGSIMHMVQEEDVIWGTGANPYWLSQSTTRAIATKITGFATRGPKTWNLLRQQQSFSSNVSTKIPVYGDPGFLTPLLYPKFQRKVPMTVGNDRFCIVPHFHDIKFLENLYKNDTTITIISPKNTWEYVVRRLAILCDYVASSSLHGLIIADTLQIPSQWVQIPTSKTATTEGWFKYLDYYESVQRFDQEPLSSFTQIKNTSAYVTPLSDEQYQNYVNTMIQSFPYHLLESKCV